MTTSVKMILAELERVFRQTDVPNEALLLDEICSANSIVCVGAGRVGHAMAGFAKRLRHLGCECFWIEDKTLPRMGRGDLMLVGSGSGETESIVGLAKIAKRENLRVALISKNPVSRLSELANVTVLIPELQDFASGVVVASQQPMTSLFEQSCQIYTDGLVLDLMSRLQVSSEEMRYRHNGIE